MVKNRQKCANVIKVCSFHFHGTPRSSASNAGSAFIHSSYGTILCQSRNRIHLHAQIFSLQATVYIGVMYFDRCIFNTFSKREEAAWPLLFLNNNGPVLLSRNKNICLQSVGNIVSSDAILSPISKEE